MEITFVQIGKFALKTAIGLPITLLLEPPIMRVLRTENRGVSLLVYLGVWIYLDILHWVWSF